MEIKAELKHPYTEKERLNFIVEYNHNLGFEIKEYNTTEKYEEEITNPETGEVEVVEYQTIIKHLEAWGYTEEELLEQEKARIAEIALTRADVFEALILARGLTKQTLRLFIEQDETLNDIEKALYLNRFDDALEFYRKHPAIDFISAKLDITPDNMDKFFDTKDYNYLKPVEELIEEESNTNETPLPEVEEEITDVENGDNLEV